jgi:hypothetical protein
MLSGDENPGGSGRPTFSAHPLGIAAPSALIGGWLVPAFAHQWQDRQKERDLKREIASDFDCDVTRTVIASQLLLARLFPEAQTSDVRRREVDRARGAARRRALAGLPRRGGARAAGGHGVPRTHAE